MPREELNINTFIELVDKAKSITPESIDGATIFVEDPKRLIIYKSPQHDKDVYVLRSKDYSCLFFFDTFKGILFIQTKGKGFCQNFDQENLIKEALEAGRLLVDSKVADLLKETLARHQSLQTKSVSGEDLMVALLISAKQGKQMFDKERIIIAQSKNNPHLFEINWMQDNKLKQATMLFNPDTKSFHSEEIEFLKRGMAAKKIMVSVEFKEAIEKLVGKAAASLRVEGK